MFSTAIAVLGLSLNLLLGLLSEEWRAMHRKTVLAGHSLGFILLGVGIYMLVLAMIPPEWEHPMLPRISIVLGAILLVGGLVWQFSRPLGAEPMPPKTGNSITGMTINGNNQVGPAADVSLTGNSNLGPNPVGLDINAIGNPGQNVTGLQVNQNGLGTGLRVTVDRPGTGVRVNVGTKP